MSTIFNTESKIKYTPPPFLCFAWHASYASLAREKPTHSAMPQDLSDEKMSEIAQALEKGRAIAAIKLYREATGVGLKEAKDAIDAIQADLHKQFPDRFAARPNTAGCSSSAALFCLTLCLVFLYPYQA
ncbi:hypothetical protein VDG1235_2824 [Verrucomicrobiia bacterium DG1235]|nr:hypothetical protein VDG1235_2824 [Verrucomicrobiae bacterium DG1235]